MNSETINIIKWSSAVNNQHRLQTQVVYAVTWKLRNEIRRERNKGKDKENYLIHLLVMNSLYDRLYFDLWISIFCRY